MTKELSVSAIRNGTVIDHISSAATFKVVEILQVAAESSIVLIGCNLPSKRIGKKGILKIENRRLSPMEVNRIAIIAPEATVNIIKEFHVVEKFRVQIPDDIEGFVRCYNPHCVTNTESVTSRFEVINRSPLQIRCVYCERVMEGAEIVIR